MTPHGPAFDTFLQVRLTTHDKERIKARAIEAGMQTSEYVRKRALGEQVERALDNGLSPMERGRVANLALLDRREAQASVALDGETQSR